jgi:hypothetical protein
MKKKLKLTMELVPESSWHNNLRSLLPAAAWDSLRKKVLTDYNNACALCGAAGALHCHEVWEYDDVKQVQTLTGCMALCPLCHAVKHVGFSEMRSTDVRMEQIIAHFMRINKCDRKTFEVHRREAFKVFEERSKHVWQVAIGDRIIPL